MATIKVEILHTNRNKILFFKVTDHLGHTQLIKPEDWPHYPLQLIVAGLKHFEYMRALEKYPDADPKELLKKIKGPKVVYSSWHRTKNGYEER